MYQYCFGWCAIYIFKSNILIIVLPTIFMVDTLIVIEKIKQGVVKNGKENE